jgi:hypothetical protein
MEHASYSSDLAPNHFWLLPVAKSALKGQRFQDSEDIQTNVMTLKTIPQHEFQKMFQTLAASLGYVHSCSRAVLQR